MVSTRHRLKTWVEHRRYGTYDRFIGWNYQYRICAKPQRTPGGWIWTYELYNRHGRQQMLRSICDRCGQDDIIYDIGASIGVYSLAIAADSLDREVFAYEPSPQTADRLRANCDRNVCGNHVNIRQVGIGDKNNTQNFYVSTYPELSSFERESAIRWGAEIDESVNVPVSTLDQEILTQPTPDLLKIDVEGLGPSVLRGARQTLEKHRPVIFIEIHQTGLSHDPSGSIRTELEDADYAITELDGYWQCEPDG